MKLLKGFGIAATLALFFAPPAALSFDDNVTINGVTTQGIVLRDATTGLPYTASGGGGGGDATAANQVTGNTSLSTIATNTTGVATAANQATANTSLSTIATQTARFPYLMTAGQGTVGIIAAAASNCTSGTAGCNMLDAANVPWTDTRGYGLIVIKVVSTTNTGAYTVETADDSSGTNIMTQTCYFYGQSLSNSVVSFPLNLTNTANYRIFCPINNGYTRVRITTTTGASSSYSLYASNQVPPYNFSQQLSTWTVQPGNTANTTPWLTTPTPSSASATAPTNTTSTVYQDCITIKGSAGVLYGLSGYSSKGSAQFIQLHNATSPPADTTVPVSFFTVPSTSNFSVDFGTYGRFFSTGIVACNSSTGPTKTVGASNTFYDAQYK